MSSSTTSSKYDCVIIGSGPGGYVAAIRAAQLGLKTAVVEKEAPGGICLNWGCIPTKALLKSAEVFEEISHSSNFGITVDKASFNFAEVFKRSRGVVDKMTKGVQFLLKKNKVDYIVGHGTLLASNKVLVDNAGKEQVLEASSIIIATGARAKTLPHLPVDNERIITYRKALDMKECPKKLLVIGAGAIGMEFAYFYRTAGADVTVVEMMPNVLPIEDEEISKVVEKSFIKKGVIIKTNTVVEKLSRQGNVVKATLKAGDKTEEWQGDYCLVAIGVQGNIENLGLETVGIKMEKGFIDVDGYMATNVPGIYAIGDIAGPPWLAHVASHEGIVAAEHIAGEKTHPVDYTSIPGCTYCQPQVGSIGLTEKAAIAAGHKIKIGKFPFTAIGKAVATNETEGFVKVIIEEKTEEVLGVHIVHAEATEMIGEASIIRSHEGVATSVLNTVHAHPTLSEAIMEAMGDALGRAIHI